MKGQFSVVLSRVSGRVAVVPVMLIMLAWGAAAFGEEIHDAAKNGNLAKVQSLLDRHPNLVSSRDGDGETPLHLAAFQGHLDVVVLLLARSAEVNIQDNNGDTPLHLASVSGHADVVERLLAEHADVNARDKSGFTALYLAANKGHYEVAACLLSHNADPNIPSSSGQTPLHQAAGAGSVDIVKLLVAHGADIDARDGSDATPLLWAAAVGATGTAEVLLANNADVKASDRYSQTPLHYAAAKGNKDLAELLIAHGANVNAKNIEGSTPLHLAAFQGHLDLAELLLAHNADVTVLDQKGRTAENLARATGHFEIAEFLQQHSVASSSIASPASAAAQTPDRGAAALHMYTYKSTFTEATKTSKKGKVLESKNYDVTVTMEVAGRIAPFSNNQEMRSADATYGDNPASPIVSFPSAEIRCSILAVDENTGLPSKWEIVIDHPDPDRSFRFVLTSEENSMKRVIPVGGLALITALDGSPGVWQEVK